MAKIPSFKNYLKFYSKITSKFVISGFREKSESKNSKVKDFLSELITACEFETDFILKGK